MRQAFPDEYSEYVCETPLTMAHSPGVAFFDSRRGISAEKGDLKDSTIPPKTNLL